MNTCDGGKIPGGKGEREKEQPRSIHQSKWKSRRGDGTTFNVQVGASRQLWVVAHRWQQLAVAVTVAVAVRGKSQWRQAPKHLGGHSSAMASTHSPQGRRYLGRCILSVLGRSVPRPGSRFSGGCNLLLAGANRYKLARMGGLPCPARVEGGTRRSGTSSSPIIFTGQATGLRKKVRSAGLPDSAPRGRAPSVLP